MDMERSAGKLRRASERRARERDGGERRQSDSEAAEVHGDLVDPEHSKGRPNPDLGGDNKDRPTNAGTDGP
ncbi:MAG TPA: hypothetical protein VGM07_09940 [Stellaceae bacterium]|jgi:hypothetical protein